jgi:hypothetical protein
VVGAAGGTAAATTASGVTLGAGLGWGAAALVGGFLIGALIHDGVGNLCEGSFCSGWLGDPNYYGKKLSGLLEGEKVDVKKIFAERPVEKKTEVVGPQPSSDTTRLVAREEQPAAVAKKEGVSPPVKVQVGEGKTETATAQVAPEQAGFNKVTFEFDEGGKAKTATAYWKLEKGDVAIPKLALKPSKLSGLGSIKGDSKASLELAQLTPQKKESNSPGKINVPQVNTKYGPITPKTVPAVNPSSLVVDTIKDRAAGVSAALNPQMNVVAATPALIGGLSTDGVGMGVGGSPSPAEKKDEEEKEKTSPNPSVPQGGSSTYPNIPVPEDGAITVTPNNPGIDASIDENADGTADVTLSTNELAAPGENSATVILEDANGDITDEFDLPLNVREAPSPLKVGVTSFSLLSLLSAFGVLGKVYLQRRAARRLEEEVFQQTSNAADLMNS